MTAISRREALQKLAVGSVVPVAVTAGLTVLPETAHASEVVAPVGALGMLYDTTKCVGCKACVSACARVNDLAPDTRLDGLHQAPLDLNGYTKNIIKLYRPADGSAFSYVKQQCMHCIDPACVSACMFSGLTKDKGTGIISWNGSKCVGCRYCEIACPYSVPKFQWEKFNPKIVKCELCKDRIATGLQPGCTTVCPTGAVIYGKREDLLREAKRRLAANPGKYFENRVFGEEDGGGTQVLYLSHVAFEKIGLPTLGTESIPERLKWQHKLYKYLALPVALYAGMVGVMRGNWKHHITELKHEQEKTGLRPQL